MTEKVPPDKFILDATAGFRTMWFNKHHPNCIYLDQRPECEPDIVGDFRDLRQFPDGSFKLIIFDPPFWIRSSTNINTHFIQRFGYLHAETWQQDLKKAISELWRILADYGILQGKWSTYHVSSDEFLRLFPCQPLIYQVTQEKAGLMGKGKRIHERTKTLWFTFMKIPDVSISKKAEQK